MRISGRDDRKILMIYLASGSPTRAQILKEGGVEFIQIPFDFDESGISKQDARSYSYRVALSKKAQFFKIYENYDRVLFADSSVLAGGQILGKACDEADALRMLDLQSGAVSSVYTAMIFVSKNLQLAALSVASYKFDKFNEVDLREYIASGDWRGKAGAMSIEGFNEKYILSSRGSKFTAMGLDLEILKRFIW